MWFFVILVSIILGMVWHNQGQYVTNHTNKEFENKKNNFEQNFNDITSDVSDIKEEFLDKLNELNCVPKKVEYTFFVDSLSQFKNFDFDSEIMDMFSFNKNDIYSIIDKLEINQEKLKEYNRILESYVDEYIEEDREYVFNLLKNMSVQDYYSLCTFYVIYETPAGTKRYQDEKIYDMSYIMNLKKRHEKNLNDQKEYEYHRNKERRLMSESLRYDVMKRDGFRCQICGATAQDGAKMHVDHIIPVAKGGKTIKSNLQTLCDRCNIGKSDKD